MAEVILFHHALGLTEGCHAFADEMRAGGHDVHTPDLFEGRTFATLDEGLAHVEDVGFQAIIARGRSAAAGLPERVVYAGLSLGVMPAQALAQTRPGAAAALLLHAFVPPLEFGGVWPSRVPLQIHTMADDQLGDAAIAREVAPSIEGAELFLYPGDRHLFTDSSLPDYDADATALVLERVRSFLAAAG